MPSTSAILTGPAAPAGPGRLRRFGSSSKVRVTSQDLTTAMLCSQRDSHGWGKDKAELCSCPGWIEAGIAWSDAWRGPV